jgi:hypothetical protein
LRQLLCLTPTRNRKPVTCDDAIESISELVLFVIQGGQEEKLVRKEDAEAETKTAFRRANIQSGLTIHFPATTPNMYLYVRGQHPCASVEVITCVTTNNVSQELEAERVSMRAARL